MLWTGGYLNSVKAQVFSESRGIYTLRIAYEPFSLELMNTAEQRTLLSTKGPLTLKHRKNTNVIYRKPYSFFVPGTVIFGTTLDRVSRYTKHSDAHWFYLGNQSTDSLAVLRFAFLADSSISLDFRECSPTAEGIMLVSELSIAFASDSTDNYLGMGMRFNTTNHYGTIVTHWADEVGPNLPAITENRTLQGRDISYAPVPFYINLKGYGLFLDEMTYSEFDFAKSDRNTMKITNMSGTLKLSIYTAETPLSIAGKYFRSHGNYTLPKPWVFGVWAAAGTDYQSKEKGQDINYSVLNTCRKFKIPLSAIFTEDWYFDFLSLKPLEDWEINRKYYPGYEQMIQDQHHAGVKHIGYFLPYISKNKLLKVNNSFRDADEKKLFTTKTGGGTYVFNFFVWPSAQFDWSNPEAGTYFHNKYYKNATTAGVDGWMNDFGEYTPYKSRSFNGAWGNTMHNQYPLLWAKNARDYMSSTKTDGDYCVFSRSGAAGLHRYNDFIFTGDRNAKYDPLSGLGGQITAVLNAGISVHPNVSVDIGAYNCNNVKPMNKQLMYRWIELGALIPVMRLHRGVQLCDHWRFDEDDETLLQWKKYAQLHAQLFPYIYTLAKQAVDFGWPLVRHLSLYHPEDPNCLKQDFQFLLGDRILSCPVVDERLAASRSDMSKARKSWRVYLPQGNWYHYWSGTKYPAGFHEVPAAPGILPMFIREGTVIPFFDKEADTFVEGVENPDIIDFEEVNKSMNIRFYGYGSDVLKLWDGTEIHCSRNPGAQGIFKVLNGHERAYSCTFID